MTTSSAAALAEPVPMTTSSAAVLSPFTDDFAPRPLPAPGVMKRCEKRWTRVCVKKDKGIENDREAMTFIFEENGSLQYKRRQIEKCKGAQQRAVEFIEATGGTVSKPRVFKLGSSDIFSWKCTNSLVLIILLHFATVVHPGVEQRT
jgi:hypothetical protein